MNDNEEIEEIERRLKEGNITEREMRPNWSNIIDSAYDHKVDPNKILNICYQLCLVDFIGDSGIKKRDERRKKDIKGYYLSYIYEFVKDDTNSPQIRHKAWDMFKKIITSEDCIQEDACFEIFNYCVNNIKDEKDTFLKQEIENTAYYLIQKYPERRTEGLFSLRIALADKSIDPHQCITYLSKYALSSPLSADDIKTCYSICDEVLEQKPELQSFTMNVFKKLYNNEENNSASKQLAKNILYRISTIHPELKNIIEQNILHNQIQPPRYDKLPELEWIHVGTEKPCEEKFRPICGVNNHPKPDGGLWTAPKEENGLSSWQNWLVHNYDSWDNWHQGKEGQVFYIEPKMDSKCMVVSTIADLEPYIIGVKNGESLSIDSLALAKDYDCFYIENPRSMKREATGAYHSYGAYDYMLCCYDVSSLEFLKPNTFTAYTEEEYKRHKELQQKTEQVRQLLHPQNTQEKETTPITDSGNQRKTSNNNSGFSGGR